MSELVQLKVCGEMLAEAAEQGWSRVLRSDGSAEFTGEWRHAFADHTARDDVLEPAEISAAVECKSVCSHPPASMYSCCNQQGV